jgi:hypothetical protein
MKKHIALGLVASTLFLAGCCTQHHVTAYEYKTVRSVQEVNTLAAQGWSVAGFTEYQNLGNPITQVYLLKRAKE